MNPSEPMPPHRFDPLTNHCQLCGITARDAINTNTQGCSIDSTTLLAKQKRRKNASRICDLPLGVKRNGDPCPSDPIKAQQYAACTELPTHTS